MFVLKKVMSLFVSPLHWILLLGLAGLWLLWSSRWQRLGRGLVAVALVLLLLLSSSPVSRWVVEPLEAVYPSYVATGEVQPDYVVVLSGGSKADPALPPVDQLQMETLARLVEGIRIFRLHPQSRLLVSGGAPFAVVAEGDVMARAARSLGVPEAAIVIENQSLDTADQARIIKQMIGSASLVLVTSAVHLPRSMALFRKQGMDPVPAPAAHRVKAPHELHWFGLLGPHQFADIHAAWHEYVGLLWARMRRLI